MSEVRPTPPPGVKPSPVDWIKKHKAASLALGGGGLFLFFAAKGKDEGDGGAAVQDEDGQLADDVGTVVQLVPVAGATSEGTFDEEGWGDAVNSINDRLDDLDSRTGQSSIKVQGKTFTGATGSRVAGAGGSGGRKFTRYLIFFPGFTETWKFFAATGKWEQVNKSNDGPGGGNNGHGNGHGSGHGGGHGGRNKSASPSEARPNTEGEAARKMERRPGREIATGIARRRTAARARRSAPVMYDGSPPVGD